jgi:hypothetical protein
VPRVGRLAAVHAVHVRRPGRAHVLLDRPRRMSAVRVSPATAARLPTRRQERRRPPRHRRAARIPVARPPAFPAPSLLAYESAAAPARPPRRRLARLNRAEPDAQTPSAAPPPPPPPIPHAALYPYTPPAPRRPRLRSRLARAEPAARPRQ